MSIAFIDLAAQQARIKDKIDARIQAVLAHGKYIMGPEVKELEEALCDFSGAKHCVSCANGTDALQLAVMALGARVGDAVFCPSFTFAATAEAVYVLGASPVFVDIDPNTYNIDPASLRRAIAYAKEKGLTPRGIIPVDLFGLPADYEAIEAIAKEEGLWIIADSAQGFGASYKGRKTGTFGDITTTSFFPAKPLGCYGDGGAIFTDNENLAKHMDSLRVHGKGTHKYDNERIGVNSRLDTIQAAILLEKLVIFEDEIERRQEVAQRYTAALSNHFQTPLVPDGYTSVWAQYTLSVLDGDDRDAVMAKAKAAGVPTVVYYPRPLHQQTAYAKAFSDPVGLMESEAAAKRVFSLPMHPYLDEAAARSVIGVIL